MGRVQSNAQDRVREDNNKEENTKEDGRKEENDRYRPLNCISVRLKTKTNNTNISDFEILGRCTPIENEYK